MRYDQMCKHHDLPTMTSDHGRLLQDSGFLKLDSPRRLSKNSARTTMREVTEWYYQSVMVQARQYSGKPGTYTIRLMGAPSTLANHPIAAGYIASIRSNIKPELTRALILKQIQDTIDQLSSLPKTSSLPLRWELPVLPQATPSWEHSSPAILPNSYSHVGARWSHGLTRTLREIMLDPQSRRPCDTSVSRSGTLELLKTRSATAFGKYGST